MRLTICLEGNAEGRVLASVDMEEIVKMTITDDIEKSNFNPQMLKSCTDTSYQCGYAQGREEAIDELSDLIDRLLWEYDKETYKDLSESFKESARLLKEQK